MILTPKGVPFHPVVVIGLGKNLLFKSVLARCESRALVHSATQILAFKEWKLGFINMFNGELFLISAARSLLSCCTVVVEIRYGLPATFAVTLQDNSKID